MTEPTSALDPIAGARIEDFMIDELRRDYATCHRDAQYAAGGAGIAAYPRISIWAIWSKSALRICFHQSQHKRPNTTSPALR